MKHTNAYTILSKTAYKANLTRFKTSGVFYFTFVDEKKQIYEVKKANVKYYTSPDDPTIGIALLTGIAKDFFVVAYSSDKTITDKTVKRQIHFAVVSNYSEKDKLNRFHMEMVKQLEKAVIASLKACFMLENCYSDTFFSRCKVANVPLLGTCTTTDDGLLKVIDMTNAQIAGVYRLLEALESKGHAITVDWLDNLLDTLETAIASARLKVKENNDNVLSLRKAEAEKERAKAEAEAKAKAEAEAEAKAETEAELERLSLELATATAKLHDEKQARRENARIAYSRLVQSVTDTLKGKDKETAVKFFDEFPKAVYASLSARAELQTRANERDAIKVECDKQSRYLAEEEKRANNTDERARVEEARKANDARLEKVIQEHARATEIYESKYAILDKLVASVKPLISESVLDEANALCEQSF